MNLWYTWWIHGLHSTYTCRWTHDLHIWKRDIHWWTRDRVSWLFPELLSELLPGLQCHLDSTLVRVRTLGMIVGESLTATMDSHGHKLSFQVMIVLYTWLYYLFLYYVQICRECIPPSGWDVRLHTQCLQVPDPHWERLFRNLSNFVYPTLFGWDIFLFGEVKDLT